MSKIEFFKVNKLLRDNCDSERLVNELNELVNKVNDSTILKDYLDNVLLLINNLLIEKDISTNKYAELLVLMDGFYQKDSGYSNNRIEWLQELKSHSSDETMSAHHLNLLSYVDFINYKLNSSGVDYFHSSGFMGYVLLNKPLERFHHDMDLYINIKDIEKVQEIFSDYDFEFEYTYEKTKDGNYRHGFKINNKIIDIPIWLSFYRRNKDGSMYVEEYYEDENKNPFTKRNYNSKECCLLSLTEGIHNSILYQSISLDALYVSKDTKRKKDIFDRKIMEPYVDEDKAKRILDSLSMEWETVDGIPDDVIRISRIDRENRNGIMFTKKRI